MALKNKCDDISKVLVDLLIVKISTNVGKNEDRARKYACV